MQANTAIDLASLGFWMLREKTAQRRAPLRHLQTSLKKLT